MALIFEPIRQLMTPQNIAIDPSASNDFSFVVNGLTCVAYRFRVFDVDNNEVVGPSTSRVDLSSTVFDGDTVSNQVTSGNLTAGNEYRYQFDAYGNDLSVSAVDTGTDILTVNNHNLNSGDTIYIQSTASVPSGTNEFQLYYIGRISSNQLALYDTYEASKIGGTKVDLTSVGSGTITISNIAISAQVKFFANSTPTFTLSSSTITEQSNEFVPVYSQAENILATSFQAFLYDSSGNLEEDSGEIFSSDIRYTFDGLRSGLVYRVQFKCKNQRGQESDTGLVPFDVSYSEPSIGVSPTVTNQRNRSSVFVEWANIVQINGIVNGSSSYVNDFITTGNTALNLSSGSNLSYSGLNIEENQTLTHIWYPDSTSFSGDIIRLDNSSTGNYLIVGYNGTQFYRNINGVIFNELPKSLTSNQVYLIAITPQNLFVVDFATV